MPMVIDDKHVKICGGVVVWDEMNNPSINDGGNTRRGLKIVVDPNSPDIPLIENLAALELQQSEFKGVLPNGGIMPVGTAGPNEFNGRYNGWRVINCTTFRIPDVYENGQRIMDHMQYLPKIYSGQVVDIVVHCNAYNNKSKGIAARMDGFEIRTELKASQQYFGGASTDTSSAFGANGGQPQQYGQPPQGGQPQQYGQPPQGGQPHQQGGYQQNTAPVQYDPNTGQPIAQNTAQVQYDPNTGQPIQSGGGQPQQAHNFLPNQ